MGEREVSYSDKKLVTGLQTELEKPSPDFVKCFHLMQNLGHLQKASEGKESENIATYNSLFKIIDRIFKCGETALLSLRLVALRVLTNACVALSKQHAPRASKAYTLIISEIEHEVTRAKPSVVFLITVFDAIALCVSRDAIRDLDKTASMLLKLEELGDGSVKLPQFGRDSLAMALDQCIAGGLKKQAFGDSTRKINTIFQALGCTQRLTLPRASGPTVTIPEPKITGMEDRIKTFDELIKMNVEDLVDGIIWNFEQFSVIEGYTAPRSAKLLLDEISELDDEDGQDSVTSLKDTAEFAVHQALDKMSQRAKFTPIHMQTEFVAILINTLDVTYPDFDDAKGPATSAAVRRAVADQTPMIAFLTYWLRFEFTRHSIERYENLLYYVCDELAKLEMSEGDTAVGEFIRELPYMSISMYGKLADMCRSLIRPENAFNILNGLNEFANEAPWSRPAFLDAIIDLTTHESDDVNRAALKIVIDSFYMKSDATREFKTQIDDFAKRQLKEATLSQDSPNVDAMLKMFFEILQLNTWLFIDIMENYSSAHEQVRPKMRKALTAAIPLMTFNEKVLEKALPLASDKNSEWMMHLYLRKVARTLSDLPSGFVDMLKAQFKERQDPRYLIPIIPALAQKEFMEYLPELLSMDTQALAAAIKDALTLPPHRVEPSRLLIELHNFDAKSRCGEVDLLPKAVDAMKVCFKCSDAITYEKVTNTIQIVLRLKYTNGIIIDTLLQMLETFKTSVKYMTAEIMPKLIRTESCRQGRQWELLKELLHKTMPTSLKVIASLPVDRAVDFISSYPDYRQLLINQGTQMKKNEDLVRALTQ